METVEWLLFVDCWGWLVTLGIACVKICWDWGHWESGVGWGRNLMTREPSWEQNGLPPMVNFHGQLADY